MSIDWWMDSPLHIAAEDGTPEELAELASAADEVDAEVDGRTALWTAVFANRPDNARVLVEAGADPWRPMMAGWSPGRLSLAGPFPDLFPARQEGIGLSAEEAATVAEGKRLLAALGDFHYDGLGLACVADISAEEAARRLGATPLDATWAPSDAYYDTDLHVVGGTDVPGGCVITQPWGYMPATPRAAALLSAGTVCYAMYANPKSGNQGRSYRNGVNDGWDLHPGGGDPRPEDTSHEILLTYLYQYQAVAYCCAFAGLRLTDARAVTGPSDVWLRLPERDYWRT